MNIWKTLTKKLKAENIEFDNIQITLNRTNTHDTTK